LVNERHCIREMESVDQSNEIAPSFSVASQNASVRSVRRLRVTEGKVDLPDAIFKVHGGLKRVWIPSSFETLYESFFVECKSRELVSLEFGSKL
jgi:hypothetical protein